MVHALFIGFMHPHQIHVFLSFCMILYLLPKCHYNQTITSEDMTSYRFLKMAAIYSEIYFRVLVSDGIC